MLIDKVITDEDVKIMPEATDALVELSKGDMRRALNVLQACHASSQPLAPRPGQQQQQQQQHDTPMEQDDGLEKQRETITTETIYTCIAAPPPEAVRQIADTLLSTSDVVTCLNTLAAIKQQRGLALADVVTALAEELGRMDVKAEVMISWMQGLADIEHRIASGAGEMVQMGAVVGVVRGGIELV